MSNNLREQIKKTMQSNFDAFKELANDFGKIDDFIERVRKHDPYVANDILTELQVDKEAVSEAIRENINLLKNLTAPADK